MWFDYSLYGHLVHKMTENCENQNIFNLQIYKTDKTQQIVAFQKLEPDVFLAMLIDKWFYFLSNDWLISRLSPKMLFSSETRDSKLIWKLGTNSGGKNSLIFKNCNS